MKLTKVCTSCDQELPLSVFGKRTDNDDGLMFTCKPCTSIYAKKRYLKNPENFKTRSNLWKENNPERYKLNGKNWRDSNKEQVKKSLVQWRKNNPDKVKFINNRLRLKHKDALSDSYIKNLIKNHMHNKGFSTKDLVIPTELVEVKRLLVLIQNKLKEIRNDSNYEKESA